MKYTFPFNKWPFGNAGISESISVGAVFKAAGKIERMMNSSYPYRERKNS